MKSKLIGIKKATYLGDSKYLVGFTNGETKTCDIKHLFDIDKRYDSSPMFQPLKNEEVLKDYKVGYSLTWNNGTIDLAPETLYALGT